MAEFEDRTYPAADGSPLPVRAWRPDRPRLSGVRGKGAPLAACSQCASPPALADKPPVAPADGESSSTLDTQARPEAEQGGAAPPVVVYLHGIQSHSGWYEASSRCLAAAGIAVYQVERRGSGRDTAHPRGHVDAAETWVRDVHAAAEFARRESAAAQVHLMGVSWGGKLALVAAADRPPLYRSVILAAPGIIPKIEPPPAVKLRIALALATGRPEKRFPIPLADPHLFTENPERVRYIAADPISLREVTARFLHESRRLDRMARRAARNLRSPAFLALAEGDRIINNDATLRLYWSLGVRRRTATYAGAHHTLEFEADPRPFFRDVVGWIVQEEQL